MAGLPEKLMAARFKTSLDRPYLNKALWNLRPVKADMSKSVGHPTLGVDQYWRLYYDEIAIAKWDVDQLAAVLYHEIMHLLRDHAGRRETRAAGPRLWNIAADMEINDDLKSENVRLPPGGVYPSTCEFPDGELAEMYYNRLLQNCPPMEISITGGMCGSCAGETQPWELGSPADGTPGTSAAASELIRRAVAQDIVDAIEHGKSRGFIPSNLERWARERLKPKVDWRKIIGAWLRQSVADVAGVVDYSRSHVSRRQSACPNVILPALRHPIPQVACVIDTSGSMSARELDIAVAETGGVLKRLGLRDGLAVIPTDAAVHSCKKVFTPSQIRLAGGGGTDMSLGIHYAAQLRPKPHVCVVLTDGLTGWPELPVAGMKVVAGIIGDPGAHWHVPSWIRKVIIPIEALREDLR